MGRRPLKRKRLSQVKIQGMHPEGRGWVTSSQGSMGRRVYVPASIPDEVCDVVYTASGDYLSGDIEKFHESSIYRREPFCRHANLCGGCSWQHIEYIHQLELKKRILLDSLKRSGIACELQMDVIASPKEQLFRNRMEYALTDTRWFYEEEGEVTAAEDRMGMGFHPEGISGRIIHIEECYLQEEPSRLICESVFEVLKPSANDLWNFKTGMGVFRNLEIRINTLGDSIAILGVAPECAQQGLAVLMPLADKLPENCQLAVNVLANAAKGLSGEEWHFVRGDGYLYEISGRFRFRYSIDSFYQPNPWQANQLFEYVASVADIQPGEIVYDLYSGIGTLSIYLAEKAGKVIGIEGNHKAVLDADFNANMNGITNLQNVRGDVLETFRPDFIEKMGNPDVIVLDPPRSGTLIEINKNIIHSGASRVVYVSCNPVSLGRDLKLLTTAFEITDIKAFDMFPHTSHIETVVLLTRKSVD
ncbi:MAG: 23S rRNA (uracil(1939)-C(5))-methyltransferase RlmD [Bacteroidales bacterium]|nr:23S rRNA (uracil(1939)-C(5))-methyltransferase RlmD [Bacteroidales bacterium]